MSILLEAVDSALASKAFKKAVGLAKQVLELDPINTRVRALTGHALLSHARKQIKARNLEAARKELDAAGEWLRTPVERATLTLLGALADDTAAQDATLRAVAAELGGSVTAAFHLRLEAGRTGRDPTNLLARAGIGLAPTPSIEAVLALTQALNAVPGDDRQAHAALLPLHGTLRRAAKGNFLHADLCQICETFLRCNDIALLRVYADSAHRRWPAHPAFLYFAAVARYGDRPEQLSEDELDALENAAELAKTEGDLRTAERISRLLFDAEDAGACPHDNPFDDMPETPHAILAALLKMAGEKAFLQLASDALGKRIFKTLQGQLGGDKKAFLSALIELMAQMGPPSMASLPPFIPAQRIDPAPATPQSSPHHLQKDLFNE